MTDVTFDKVVISNIPTGFLSLEDKKGYKYFNGRYATLYTKNDILYTFYGFTDTTTPFGTFVVCVKRSKNGKTLSERWYYNERKSSHLSLGGNLVGFAKRLCKKRNINPDWMHLRVLYGEKTV